MKKLPKISVATFKTELLTDKNIEIEYRNWTSGEQELLLISAESQDTENYVEAIKKILNICIITEDIDIEEMPSVDLQYMFLKIAGSSAGEVKRIKLSIKDCIERDECVQKVSVNIDKLEIFRDETHNKKIMLDDDIGIIMKYPSSKILATLETSKIKSDTMLVIKIMNSCIDQIFTKDDVWKVNQSDATNTEKQEFVEFCQGFSGKNLKDITDFFSTIPTLKKEINITCKKCKREITYTLDKISDFFG